MQRSSPIKRSSLSDKEGKQRKQQQHQPQTTTTTIDHAAQRRVANAKYKYTDHDATIAVAYAIIPSQGKGRCEKTYRHARYDAIDGDGRRDAKRAIDTGQRRFARSRKGTCGAPRTRGGRRRREIDERKKTKNLMLMGIAMFRVKTTNRSTQARARWEVANWLLRTQTTKQTIVGRNWTQGRQFKGGI